MDLKQVITKQSIQKLHEKHILNGDTNIANTSDIIDILGGIDGIISHYLHENTNDELTDTQLRRLYQLYALKTKINHQNGAEETDAAVTKPRASLSLDPDDTILSSFCSPKMAPNIKNKFIYNKTIVKLLVILSIIAAILYIITYVLWKSKMAQSIFDTYMTLFIALLAIPYLILQHLSMNKIAFSLCLKSFDYWIKMGYCIVSGMVWWVMFLESTLRNIRGFFAIIFAILLISASASIDAINMSKKKKLSLSLLPALFYTVWMCNYQFFVLKENDSKIVISLRTGVHIISMQSVLAGAFRVLTLFFWKQCANFMRKDERAMCITFKPKLIWRDDREGKEIDTVKCEDQDQDEVVGVDKEGKVKEIETENATETLKQKSFSVSIVDRNKLEYTSILDRNEDEAK